MLKNARFALAILLVFPACSTGPRTEPKDAPPPPPEEVFHTQFRSKDTAFQELMKSGRDIESVAILGINDFHGALAPLSLKTREPEGVTPVPYEAGGATMLGAHLKIQRERHGEHLVLVDAGDEYQGSIESNTGEGKPVVEFFNELRLHAAAIGNHEFDFGPVGPEGIQGDLQGALKQRVIEARYPYVSANIREKSTGQPPAWQNFFPSTVVMAGRLKVGVIGLTTRSTPVTTRATYVENLEFIDLATVTVEQAAALRSQGANIVVVVAHVGISCVAKHKSGHALRRPEDPQGECDPREEMAELLHAIPAGTVDAVVSGHSHTIVHHWVNGIPVIQGGSLGRYYNLIHLSYDWQRKKVLSEMTRIEGPIPVCPAVFKNQYDCNGDGPAPKSGRGSLVTPKIYGKEVHADSDVAAVLKSTFERSAEVKKKIVGQAARPLEPNRRRESELGNIIADAIRAKVKADVAVVNPGGIRAPIEQGPITYEAVFRTLPFDNSVAVLKVTGKELRNILRVAQSGSRGYFPVSGVRLHLIELEHDAPADDLNGDGKKEHWEVNRLQGVEMDDGSELDDGKTYTLAAPDFLVTGGDDMGWPMSQVPKQRVKLDSGAIMRDAMIEYLAQAGALNTPEKPAVDPARPRLILEKPKAAAKGKRHKRKK